MIVLVASLWVVPVKHLKRSRLVRQVDERSRAARLAGAAQGRTSPTTRLRRCRHGISDGVVRKNAEGVAVPRQAVRLCADQAGKSAAGAVGPAIGALHPARSAACATAARLSTPVSRPGRGGAGGPALLADRSRHQ